MVNIITTFIKGITTVIVAIIACFAFLLIIP